MFHNSQMSHLTHLEMTQACSLKMLEHFSGVRTYKGLDVLMSDCHFILYPIILFPKDLTVANVCSEHTSTIVHVFPGHTWTIVHMFPDHTWTTILYTCSLDMLENFPAHSLNTLERILSPCVFREHV
jgi:hypothetical protein